GRWCSTIGWERVCLSTAAWHAKEENIGAGGAIPVALEEHEGSCGISVASGGGGEGAGGLHAVMGEAAPPRRTAIHPHLYDFLHQRTPVEDAEGGTIGLGVRAIGEPDVQRVGSRIVGP